MRPAAGLDATLRALARFSVGHRLYAALWDRETRALPPGQRATIRKRHRAVVATMTEALRAERPDLSAAEAGDIALAAIAVLVSPSYHHTNLPPAPFEALLQGMASAVCRTRAVPMPVPSCLLAVQPGPGLTPVSRREALLLAGMRPFREFGFQAVSMEDIGAAAGISGPSVYTSCQLLSASSMLM